MNTIGELLYRKCARNIEKIEGLNSSDFKSLTNLENPKKSKKRWRDWIDFWFYGQVHNTNDSSKLLVNYLCHNIFQQNVSNFDLKKKRISV